MKERSLLAVFVSLLFCSVQWVICNQSFPFGAIIIIGCSLKKFHLISHV